MLTVKIIPDTQITIMKIITGIRIKGKHYNNDNNKNNKYNNNNDVNDNNTNYNNINKKCSQE